MKKYIQCAYTSDYEFNGLLDWLADHSQAYSDCCDYFGVTDLDDLDPKYYNDIVSWIADHDQLYDDYLNHSTTRYRVYYNDGNQRLYEAPNIVELVNELSDIDNDYSKTIYKIERVMS